MPRQATLSLELLQTFLTLVHNGGDAAQAAIDLEINQPSMSKRLRHFQHAGPLLKRPWLERQGKSWILTDEGNRVLPAVEEILQRHAQLTRFIDEPIEPVVRFACGQQAAAGFVRRAAREFRRDHPETSLQISTLRGEARIEGVASGSLDLATVTHAEADIHRIARRELHVEELCRDHLVLVCAEKSPWAASVEKLAKTKVAPEALSKFPLILPSRDSGLRQWFDETLARYDVLATLNVVLETGGWSTILAYVEDGFGVGVLPASTTADPKTLIMRTLNPEIFPPRITRIICRKSATQAQAPDLCQEAKAFRESLLAATKG